jgi:hypothetical protein
VVIWKKKHVNQNKLEAKGPIFDEKFNECEYPNFRHQNAILRQSSGKVDFSI